MTSSKWIQVNVMEMHLLSLKRMTLLVLKGEKIVQIISKVIRKD